MAVWGARSSPWVLVPTISRAWGGKPIASWKLGAGCVPAYPLGAGLVLLPNFPVSNCCWLAGDLVSSRKKWWACLSRSCSLFSRLSCLCREGCRCQADEAIKVDSQPDFFAPAVSVGNSWRLNLIIISALNFIYGQFIVLNCCASIVLEQFPSLPSTYSFDVCGDSDRVPSLWESLSLPSYTRQSIPATSCKTNSPFPGSSNPSSSALDYSLVIERLASAMSPAGSLPWPCKIWSD